MLSCWVVTEAGLTGTENQGLGVAEALGITPSLRRIGLRQPWKTLSPWLGFEGAGSFTGDALAAPWPDLVIAGGRKAAAAARYIKKASGGKTFTLFLQDPRINPAAFDLVAVPAHDRLRGANVIVTQGTPNGVTPARLKAAREKFAARLGTPPAPRVAVLIGGNSRTHKFTPALATKLAQDLRQLAQKGYSLMVTASRRTGAFSRAALEDALKGENVLFWDGTGENPYHGFLAWADYIIVTSDSASMISEAATTGKPVYIVPLEGGSARFDRLYKSLADAGITRTFQGELTPYSYAALNDAALVAQEITRRIKKRV